MTLNILHFRPIFPRSVYSQLDKTSDKKTHFSLFLASRMMTDLLANVHMLMQTIFVFPRYIRYCYECSCVCVLPIVVPKYQCKDREKRKAARKVCQVLLLLSVFATQKINAFLFVHIFSHINDHI